MPNATRMIDSDKSCSYTVAVRLEQVKEFYLKEMVTLGWQSIGGGPFGESVTVLFQKGDQRTSFILTQMPTYTGVLIAQFTAPPN